VSTTARGVRGTTAGELSKVAAFVRRDFLIVLSYRAAFLGDFVQLAAQTALFALFSRVVDPDLLPSYGGTKAGYLEFVVIGASLAIVTGILLQRVATAIRTEQMVGTLEALLVTPTKVGTIQVGAVALEMLEVPLRLALFLLALSLGLGLDLELSGALPALVVLAAYLPFVWGLGLLSGALVVTFRKGAGVTGLAVLGLGIASGAYVPLSALPHWVQGAVSWNPMARALDGLRETLIGGSGWGTVAGDVLVVAPLSAITLAAGAAAFSWAVARERRQGTLGVY
jgi:ABC-2 type transport system permease protein